MTNTEELHEIYKKGKPFSHLVLDGLVDEEVLLGIFLGECLDTIIYYESKN
jgi:hypothetical protein